MRLPACLTLLALACDPVAPPPEPVAVAQVRDDPPPVLMIAAPQCDDANMLCRGDAICCDGACIPRCGLAFCPCGAFCVAGNVCAWP